MKGLAWGWKFALAAAASTTVGCGSDSDDCAETRTCSGSTGGSGGSGGKGGTDGGAATGGTGGSKACGTNSECDDGVACNGEEFCAQGKCAAGTPVACNNPNPDHCDATCIEVAAGGTNCEIKAKDADGDQHGDALCVEAVVVTPPPDDCDDAHATAHPGASEVCDGFDNDCNGKDEFDENLVVLAGTAEDFATATHAHDAAVAWSPDAKGYGVVWSDERFAATGGSEIFFALMGSDGSKITVTDERISTAAGSSEKPRIAFGNGSFGVVWQDKRGSDYEIYFARVGVDGLPIAGSEKRLTTATGDSLLPDIVPAGSGWAVVWSDKRSGASQVYAMRLSNDGAPIAAEQPIGIQGVSAGYAHAAASTTGLFVTYAYQPSASAGSVVHGVWSNLDFAIQDQRDLTGTAPPVGQGWLWPAAGRLSNGWGAAYINIGSTPLMTGIEFETTGAQSCFRDYTITPGAAPGAILPEGDHTLVFYADVVGTTWTMAFLRAKDACTNSKFFEIDTDVNPESIPTHPIHAAAGDAGYAVVWSDWNLGKIRRRAFGASLCDTAK